MGTQAAALISIYDAAGDSEGWNSSLDTCVEYVGAHSANIMFQENDVNSPWRYALGSERWRSCSEAQIAKSISVFEKYDSHAWKFIHQHPKQKLFVDTDYWNETENLEQREDYQFFREELGFTRKVGSTLNDNYCWTDNIAFQFPTHLHTIPDHSLQRISHLLPHVAKSIELWRTFSILKSQYKAVLSALDHVRIGLCIAEPGGSIIVTNDEAKRIFERSSSIRLGKDKLIHCRSKTVENAIRLSIEKSCATSAGEASISEAFQVLGITAGTQISVEIAPLRDSGTEISRHFNGALITLIDFSADLQIDCTKIASAYKLSSTETEVCQLLIHGTSINEIAENRNVKPETIKSQSKSIYRKTASKNRVELTRLALKASPPVS